MAAASSSSEFPSMRDFPRSVRTATDSESQSSSAGTASTFMVSFRGLFGLLVSSFHFMKNIKCEVVFSFREVEPSSFIFTTKELITITFVRAL